MVGLIVAGTSCAAPRSRRRLFADTTFISKIVEISTIFVELGDRGFASRELDFFMKPVSLVKNMRQPFSIKAKPSAAAKCDFPPPGGPKRSQSPRRRSR